MNFLQQIKNDLYSERNLQYARSTGKITVNYHALRDLLISFEKLDSERRCDYPGQGVCEHFRNQIELYYHYSRRDIEEVLYQVMDVLKHRVEEQRKEKALGTIRQVEG